MSVIVLPPPYNNAPIRPADMTQTMIDLYNVVAQINASQRAVQRVVPTTGQTVQMTDNGFDGTLFIDPAGTINTLTVVFPSAANSILGQIRFLGTSQGITNLTLSGGTFLNMIPSLNANDCFAFQKVKNPDTWIFIQ